MMFTVNSYVLITLFFQNILHSKMSTATAHSLQTLCLRYIADNLHKLCNETKHVNDGEPYPEFKLSFKTPDTKFYSDLAEQLLQVVSQRCQLNDKLLSLFGDPCVMCLRRANIKSALLTSRGLKALTCHQLLELDASGVRRVNVNDIIGALGEWTRRNIRSLNVSECTFLDKSKFCIVISLRQLRSLRHLNVSYTEFSNQLGLEYLAEGLPLLESLDISGTLVYSIQPLLRRKHQLKSLCMFQTRVPEKDLIPVLLELKELRILDISQDAHPMLDSPHTANMNVLLQTEGSLPNIISLDISGRDNISETALQCFLKTHETLRFLGLTLTQGTDQHQQPKDICGEDILVDECHQDFKPDLKVGC